MARSSSPRRLSGDLVRRFEAALGVVVSLIGVGILTRLDFGYISGGGWAAIPASFELLIAVLVVSLAAGFAATGR